MFEKMRAIKEMFGSKKEGTENLPKKLPSAREAFESQAERREREFDFETAVALREKAPGKGEDRIIVYNDNEKSLHAVLDGMGGQEGGGGDVAAQIVAESFQKALTKETNLPKDSKVVEKLMKDAVIAAHKELSESPTSAIYEKMGTTLSAMLSYDNKATLVSVGDSRIYRRRNGKLEQLSYEDSVIHMLRANGLEVNTAILSSIRPDGSTHDVTLNEAVASAKRKADISETGQKIIDTLVSKFGSTSLKRLRNINTQGIAAGEGSPVPHVLTVDIEDGDEFLITSDGLTDNCQDRNIEQGLNKLDGKSAHEKAANLRAYAEKMQNRENYPDANKPDDISIIYIEAKSKKGAREEEIEEISMDELEEVGT